MGVIRESVLHILKNNGDMSIIMKMIGLDGGAGSGNFGHAGRPGMVGGSAGRNGGSGGGGVSKERAKEIQKERDRFKKLSREDKISVLKRAGQIAYNGSKFDEDSVKDYADRHKMSVDKYLDWRAARWYTMRKFQPEIDYKTPKKPLEVQGKYIEGYPGKRKYIMEHTGCNEEVAEKMRRSLSDHFGNGHADCKWTDKFIDSDSRYEGAIYRWKTYGGDRAKKVVAGLVPGAKVENKNESNWSFSSDPWATKHFGAYNDHMGGDIVTIRYTCDRNITGSPVQCLSSFGAGEAEVIPHSKTTWTITNVEKVRMPKGGIMYDVHMVEDDWHEEKGIPVWKPGDSELDGGWKKDFPKTDSSASNTYESVKKSKSTTEMVDFMKKCPDGTEFYQIGSETVKFMRKTEDGWMVADITNHFNESINEGITTGKFSDAWTSDDQDIWGKIVGSEIVKKASDNEVRGFLMSDDTMMLQVGGKDVPLTAKEISTTLEDMKKQEYEGDPLKFFESLPDGITLIDNTNGDTYIKNGNNWDNVDMETGEVKLSFESLDMVTCAVGNSLYDMSLKSDENTDKNLALLSAKQNKDERGMNKILEDLPMGTTVISNDGKTFIKKADGSLELSGENVTYSPGVLAYMMNTSPMTLTIKGETHDLPGTNPPMTPMEEHDHFVKHDTYGGVASALVDFKGGSVAECEKWVSGFKEGTVFQQNKNGKPGMLLVCEGDGNWGIWKPEDSFKSATQDNEFAAWCLANPDLDFSVKNIPLNIPDNSSDADSVFKGIKHENPQQMEAFAHVAPNGTMVMDVEGGYVYCKQNGNWESLNYEFEAPNFDPENSWSDYDDATVKNLDQKAIPGKFNNEGTFVLKVGKE